MKKRKSPKEVIESIDKPILEQSWAKRPREEPSVTSIRRDKDGVAIWSPNYPHTDIHTHPDLTPRYEKPSLQDYIHFLRDKNQRTMVVAQTNPENGVLRGYYIVRKTEKTKNLTKVEKILDTADFIAYKLTSGIYPGLMLSSNLDKKYKETNVYNRDSKIVGLKKEYHLQSRYVPNKDFNEFTSDSNQRKKKSEKSLERTVATAAILSLVSSALFLSNNITGNVIANLSEGSSNILGVILFLIGLAGTFFYLRMK